ncbi:MAG: HD domain-containing protein [Defluviitaleaceae bacterium]|nr:HD domain-containing protein [Defluviitaleaceae bacterium]
MQKKQIYIADTIHNTILMSIYEKEVISTQLFNRLHNISQNSTGYLTFPTNRTKRFEHSLGTMKLCGDMIYYSFVNSADSVIHSLLDDVKKSIVEHIVKKRILNQPDTFRSVLEDLNIEETKLLDFEKIKVDNVFYNDFIPANIPGEKLIFYLILFQAIRLCALLHDIGHPPFSHVAESAIDNAIKIVSNKTNHTPREKEFLDIFSEYEIDKPSSQLHEKMGNKMTEKMVSDLLFNGEWHKDRSFGEKYLKILVFETVKCIFEEKDLICETIHKIVDGVIDGDRLDYVCRDTINSGITSGYLEYDRLISSMQIVKIDDKYLFVTDAKTVNTVDDFFYKRWNLYKSILYHHRVIKTDSLLRSSIEIIMLDYLSKNDSVNNAHDDYILPYDISGLWKAIKIATSNRRYFNSLIQWDDGWLITVLKKHYFEEYYDRTNAVSYQLEELLSNKKNYYSIIKNASDFKLLDKGFCSIFNEYELCETQEFKKIDEILNRSSSNVPMLYKLETFFETYEKDEFNFFDFVKMNTKRFIESKYKENVEYFEIVKKRISSGLEKEQPNLYKNGSVVPLCELSNIINTLNAEKYNCPYFYIYLKFKRKEIYNYVFNSNFLNELGIFLAKNVIDILDSMK